MQEVKVIITPKGMELQGNIKEIMEYVSDLEDICQAKGVDCSCQSVLLRFMIEDEKDRAVITAAVEETLDAEDEYEDLSVEVIEKA